MAEAYADIEAPLSVVILTYLAEPDAVALHRPAHIEWLKGCYENSGLLASGRQRPPVGGVFIFRGDKGAVEAIAATDPFVLNGMARAEVTHFITTLAAPAIAAMLGE